MSNFVDDLTDLPGPKTQVTPVPEGEEDNAMSADDYNTVRQASYDMRGAIIDLREEVDGLELADNAVTNAKLRDSAALSVIGRSANSTGDPADIAAGSDGDVLRRSGTALGFGAIPESSVTNLTSDLAGKAAASHTHAEADITNLTTDLAAKQPLDAGLTSLAGLGATAGLIEKTATDTYTERAIGVATGASIPTRSDADTRYAAASHTHPESDITNLTADLASRLTANGPWFGDGLDGPLTFDGTTTVLGIVPAGNTYVLTKDICGTTIVINSGVSIRFAGYRMMATVSIENNGTKVGNYGIDASGVSAGASTGAGVIASGVGGVAGKVGPGAGTNGTASGGVYTGWSTLAAAAAGATGGTGQGSGGASVGGNNGGTGGALTIASHAGGRSSLKTGMTGEVERGTTQLTWASSGGSGAVVGGTNGNSGGTGGGGSLTYIGAPLITGTGRFTSKGGDAGASTLGNSTGVGGSAGSGGGWIYVVYMTRTGSLTIDADGGAGANGAGTGGAGPNGGPGTVTLKNLSGDGT